MMARVRIPSTASNFRRTKRNDVNISWHGDDDEVDKDSVGWFNARDYESSSASDSFVDDDHVSNDSYGWFNSRDYPKNEFL